MEDVQEILQEAQPFNGKQHAEKLAQDMANRHFQKQLLKFKVMRMDIHLQSEDPGMLWNRSHPEMLKKPPTAADRKKADFPEKAYNAARHIMLDGRDGVPGGALKKCIAQAATRFYGIDMALIYGQIRVRAEFVPLDLAQPVAMREDVVFNGFKRKAAVLAYRPWYRDWKLVVPVSYWENRITEIEVVNLFNIAGHSVGLGAWRIEKGGDFGGFRVIGTTRATPQELYTGSKR